MQLALRGWGAVTTPLQSHSFCAFQHAGMDDMSARAAAREAQKAERELDEGDGEEDAEERRKLWAQDDFREMHARGSGNRYNRS